MDIFSLEKRRLRREHIDVYKYLRMGVRRMGLSLFSGTQDKR